ncbi:glycosyltransferase [Candidatus Planktophila versatilis]|uniref:Glycosyltransferase n=1 Tax=Candidatus Planktophila versatilis TaxID=1884905 RepID=A0AAC9YV37_9ACTN|nr:glycosyltransferase [Candidatus Planktophila versatilis]ASY22050.1 glycosyltransferase [Candidatus Planktophila versatilis]
MNNEKIAPILELIIPCYNEASGLNGLLEICTFATQTFPVAFILVNNGSTDESEIFFQKIDSTRIRTLSIKTNLGYGNGVKQGLLIATAPYIGWLHADMQINLDGFLHELFKEGFTGDFFYKGKRTGRKFSQLIFTIGMSSVMSFMFHKPLNDINGQPTIFSSSLLQRLEFAPDDFTFDLFVYLVAKKNGYKIRRIPVAMQERKHGQSSWNTGICSALKLSRKMFSSARKIKSN